MEAGEFFPGQGLVQQPLQRFLVQGLEAVNLQPAEQGAIEFKGGIFGGGPEQQQGAALQHRQENVLLGLIKPVNLVEEQHRRLAGRLIRLGPAENFAEFFGAGGGGRQRLEISLPGPGDNLGQTGFATAGRAPEQQGMGTFQRQPQGLARAGKRFLAHHLIQGLRA